MSSRQLRQKFITTLAGLFLVLPILAHADGDYDSKVPEPKAKATEEFGCVAPISDMRKNHMEKLLHQRDKTMHDGIRTKTFSLEECIDCHITPKKDGTYANFGEDEFFCSSCHNYAAVKVDCFDCHRDKPDDVEVEHSMIGKPNPHKKNLAFNHNKSLTKAILGEMTSGGTE